MLVASWVKVTISNGASLSNPLDIRGSRVIALRQGANCEGTVFTAQASYDGVTYEDLHTDAAEWSVTKSATAAQVLTLPDSKRIQGPTHLKIRSGSSATPTNQTGADAEVWVCLVPIDCPV